MNRAQRRIHRRAWLVLAVALPMVLALAALLRLQHARALVTHERNGAAP